MLGMLKRHEVEILLKAGHPKTEVARLAGVSLCSVKRIAEETPVLHVDDAAEREKRQIGRPSLVRIPDDADRRSGSCRSAVSVDGDQRSGMMPITDSGMIAIS
jgi:hypothetical protein